VCLRCAIVFERFTQEARQVVVAAQQEARDLRHNYIGTEHLLLGLMRQEPAIACQTLESLEISHQQIRAEVLARVGPGRSASPGQMPFTARAKHVLELSLREALSLGHHYIGTEHILLAITAETEGMASQILVDHGVDERTIRGKVLELLPTRTPEQRGVSAGRGTGSAQEAGVVMSRSGGSAAAWLDGVGPLLSRLGAEIPPKLKRGSDSGDLLMVLALSPGTLAAEALRELGIEIDVLQEAIERSRAASPDPVADPRRRLSEIRRAKEEAIANQRFEEATRLRDQEREASAQARTAAEPPSEVVAEIRSRLGLAGPAPGDAPGS